MHEDDTGSAHKESNRFISSNSSCAMDDDMSVDSIERRTLFEKEITNGRKKFFDKISIDSDLKHLENW